MAMISAFIAVDKMVYTSLKFAFTLSPTNYGYWKNMIKPFLITKNLMYYVDGSIPCPSKTLSVTNGVSVLKENFNYPIWVSNDAHTRMLIISTISKASFRHVHGTTFHDLWFSLKKAYAPHSKSREYTLKTQLLRIKIDDDDTPDAYLNCAKKYADALAVIGEPIKDKYLVMLVVLGLQKEYNGLKTTITVRQSPTAFSELHALLSDHDYMLGKTRTPIAPYGPQAFYGACPSNNNMSNNHGNHNNSHDTEANSHVTPDLDAMDNSEAYYGDDALHVSNGKGLPNLHIVLHLSPTSQTSPESSNGQPSRVSTTSIPTPLPPTPQPPAPPPPTPSPPPPITRQHPANLYQNPKQRVSYNPSTNHATVLPTTITEPTSFTIANNSPKWRQAMKEEYDALVKNGTWSLVPRASNTNVVDGIDFYETFSPVVNSTTIRAVLSLAVTNNWPLRQLDVHNAFFHGNLKERVYMKQPSGFINPQLLNHVCLLHKALYGLKQASRAWYEHLFKALFDLGFKSFKTNLSLLIYSHGHTLLYTLVYVNDIIVIGNPDTSLEGFLDADWAGDSDNRRSTGDLLYIYIGSNFICWTTRKQRMVLRSSTEAEYKAFADIVAELTWLQALLHEFGIRSSSIPILWCDNLGATYLSVNPIFRARTKHVEIDYHFVQKKVAQGDLRVRHISTHDQITDIFTKSLPTPRFLFLRSKLQVVARP
nr:hypothetical protein [Tanacetum cinerariifolium]